MFDQMIGGKYIEKKIRTPKAGGPAIIPFITAGYPNTEDFKQTLHEIAKKADVIEIGVPFSDPMADVTTRDRHLQLLDIYWIRLKKIMKWHLQRLMTLNPLWSQMLGFNASGVTVYCSDLPTRKQRSQ